MSASRRQHHAALLDELSAIGVSSAGDLARRLGVSQPTLSRAINQVRDQLVVLGRARATLYARRRPIDDVSTPVPIYALNERAQSSLQALLHPVSPAGFALVSNTPDIPSAFHADLPWFLNDLRPAGFLGAALPRQYPNLRQASINLWNASDVLRYLMHFGADTIGNFVIGDEALTRTIERLGAPEPAIAKPERPARYRALAAESLITPTGSSAGGEQPKFLAIVDHGSPTPVIVKFSPQVPGAVSERWADLLVAEHLAHEVLNDASHTAASSELLRSGSQCFLEIRRFDRTPGGGRRGVISLASFDHQLAGNGGSWSDIAAELSSQGRIDAATLKEIRFQDLFGALIANDDRHSGNISFFVEGTRILARTPTYDMLPMLYRPLSSDLPPRTFGAPSASPQLADIWLPACTAALAFWRRVASDPRISAGFRAIAATNETIVERSALLARFLPREP